MNVADRNEEYKELMHTALKKAQQKSFTLDKPIENLLTEVFSCKARGFREILLVIALSKKLNPKFDAYAKFYDCNPRAVYEGPIRTVLDEFDIPRGKSGPLNVAKASEGINEAWAAQRRPKSVAEAVVKLVSHINSLDTEGLDSFLIRLHQKFLAKAEENAAFSVEIDKGVDVNSLFRVLSALIQEEPDRGNTPQKIVANILKALHDDFESQMSIDGLDDDAFTTNTTSKKPADVMLVDSQGVRKGYEVSVKHVDQNRLEDSWESVRDHIQRTGQELEEIIYLCRPEDVEESGLSGNRTYLGSLEYKQIVFHFYNLHAWIHTIILTIMTPKARDQLLKLLNAYIGDKDTRVAVKRTWKRLLEEEGIVVG